MPDGSRFCASCGKPITSTAEDATIATIPPDGPSLETSVGVSPPSEPKPRSATTDPFETSVSAAEDRFIPGTVIAGRYRIVALLGRGGMSEVYRATDLKLGQSVALKFLPEGVSRDPVALERFRNEVRIARRISHPNVCRVYDIGEVDNHHFISMEYVDGEDLGSLLRRIGRLPRDKALDIARDLCSGLTPAHDQGILHRDLKPANVMVDGRGHVLIMDFGIAALAEQIQKHEIRSGTPAYMAPEQLSGEAVTTRSDIYALGLVMYELFTGKRAVESETMIELARLQQTDSATGELNLIKGLDPQMERVIMRCLEKDPAKRPATVREVAAALPGGDPLLTGRRDARTLSPEMIAAAGNYSGIRPVVGLACMLVIVAGLIFAPYLTKRSDLIEKLPMDNPPEALVTKSREMLKDFGYPQRPFDKAYGFFYDIDYMRYAETTPEHRNHLIEGRPPAITFWYRESPRYMEPTSILEPWKVTPNDPPIVESGMLYIETDVQGHLSEFTAIPPQVDDPKTSAITPTDAAMVYDWEKLFKAAGLNFYLFTPTTPSLTPPSICDARAAWTGNYPGQIDNPLRIEVAGYRGKLIFFKIIGPWYRPARMETFQRRLGEKIAEGGAMVLFLGALIGAAVMARTSLRRENGDSRGASRLAIFIFSASALGWIVGANHVLSTIELHWLLLTIANSLLNAAIAWLLYVALEPYVRRGWPKVIISWSKLLSGRFRDPLVGRDVLVGIMFGVIVYLLISLSSYLLFLRGAPPSTITRLETLLGMRQVLALFFEDVVLNSIQAALIALFLFFIFRVVFRLKLAAGIPFVLLLVGFSALTTGFGIQTVAMLLTGLSAVFVLQRFGLVSFIALVFTFLLLGTGTAVTPELTIWYANGEIFSMLVLLALSGWGFHSALAGKSIFPGKLLED